MVPQASKPVARLVIAAALQVPELDTTLITTAVGMAGVSGLLTNDFKTDKETNALGVITQVQHEINSSAGSKVYKLAQILAPVAPLLVMFTIESPTFRLLAYRI